LPPTPPPLCRRRCRCRRHRFAAAAAAVAAAAAAATAATAAAAAQQLSDIRAQFIQSDSLENGCITPVEFRGALAAQGVAAEEMEQLFTSLDVDQSGKIRYRVPPLRSAFTFFEV
jgi:hypothetical protein